MEAVPSAQGVPYCKHSTKKKKKLRITPIERFLGVCTIQYELLQLLTMTSDEHKIFGKMTR